MEAQVPYLYYYITNCLYAFFPGSGYEMPAEVVIKIIENEYNLQYVEKMIPVIVDVLSLCVSKVTEKEDVVLAKFGVTALKILLTSLIKLLNLHKCNVS